MARYLLLANIQSTGRIVRIYHNYLISIYNNRLFSLKLSLRSGPVPTSFAPTIQVA